MGASTAPGRRLAFAAVSVPRGKAPARSRESRYAFQPPTLPSSRRQVHELPSEGTSDASSQIASVCRTDAASVDSTTPIRTGGQRVNKPLDFWIRLVPWQSKQTRSNARQSAIVPVCAIWLRKTHPMGTSGTWLSGRRRTSGSGPSGNGGRVQSVLRAESRTLVGELLSPTTGSAISRVTASRGSTASSVSGITSTRGCEKSQPSYRGGLPAAMAITA